MNKLIVLTGPTAVGKTSLSIKLAKILDTEIISADSMQVYKGMDIGTAKIIPDEMDNIPHHMIDIIDIDTDYDVYSFKTKAIPIINDLQKNGKIPLIVGGTGFYIQALCYDIEFDENVDLDYREHLNNLLNEKGADALYDLLLDIDPEYANITHKNNTKRVIRALEYFHSNKEKLSSHNKEQMQNTSPYDLKYFVLTKDRESLYNDINKRVDIMMENGFLDEVRALVKKGLNENSTAGKALGYAELIKYLNNEYSLDYAIEKIKQNTRHFAKRQLTWFRREKDVTFINKNEYKTEEDILEFILNTIND